MHCSPSSAQHACTCYQHAKCQYLSFICSKWQWKRYDDWNEMMIMTCSWWLILLNLYATCVRYNIMEWNGTSNTHVITHIKKLHMFVNVMFPLLWAHWRIYTWCDWKLIINKIIYFCHWSVIVFVIIKRYFFRYLSFLK